MNATRVEVILGNGCRGTLHFAIMDLTSDVISNRVVVAHPFCGHPIADGQQNEVLLVVSHQTRLEEVVDVSQFDAAGAPQLNVMLLFGEVFSFVSARENVDAYDGAWRLSDEHVPPEGVRNIEDRFRHVSHGVWCETCWLGGI